MKVPTLPALMKDFYSCLKNSHVWFTLSFYDIRARYRRTVIGPFWLTLGTATVILGMGLVWSGLFEMSIKDFLPYFATGMVIWVFIASILNESCSVFTSQAGIIHNVKLPYCLYVMIMVSRNIIIMFHNLIVVAVVFVFCGKGINFEILWTIPGFLLLIMNSIWVGIVLGVFSTRYRDVASIVVNLTTLIMFVTPIMWKIDMLHGDRKYIALFNPFTHVINIVREPLLGHPPSLESYSIVLSILIGGLAFSMYIYKKYSSRIVFWM